MIILLSLFLFSLSFGQLISIKFTPNLVIYLYDLLLGLIFAYSLSKHQFKWVKIFKSAKLSLPITSFIFIAIFSLFFNVSRYGLIPTVVGSLYLVRWIFYLGIYYLILVENIDKKTWLGGLLFSGTSIAILGAVQFMLYPDLRNLAYLGWDPHYYRLFSTLLDPNFAGLILVLNFFLCLNYLKIINNIRIFFILMISLIGIYLTYSRSSYLALIAGVFILGYFSKLHRLLYCLAIIFIFIIVLLPTPGGKTLKLLRDDTTLARIGNWKRGLELFYESPILGHGFNTLREVQAKKGWITSTSSTSHAAAGLDNSFLFVLATTGLSGFLSFLWLILKQFKLAISGAKNKIVNPIGAIYIASFMAIIIHSFFNNSLFYPWIMIWMWTLTGAIEKN